MARAFAAASSQRIDGGSAPVTAVPLTIACWALSNDVTVNYDLIAISDGAAAGSEDTFVMSMAGATAGDPIRAHIAVGGSYSSASTSSGFTAGAWHHACGVYASATSRTVYLNGGSAGTSTTSRVPAGIAEITIASNGLATPGGYLDGQICEVGVWNIALSAAEVAMLADGFAPPLVRPDGLVFYAPLVRDIIDTWGGVVLTNVDSTVSAHNIKTIYPTIQRRVFHPAAVVGTTIPEMMAARQMGTLQPAMIPTGVVAY